MPVLVTCQCGKKFKAPDKLAGKRIRCPNCKEPLAIPALQAEEEVFAAEPVEDPVVASAADDDDDGELELAITMVPCPGCGGKMASTAVLCLHCGYHKKLGKRLAGPH